MDSRSEDIASAFFFLAPMVLFGLLTGCAEDSAVAPVEGLLTYHGKPVANAHITFFHHDQQHPGRAVSGADGKFHVSTWVADDGALVGQHRITVALAAPAHEHVAGPDAGHGHDGERAAEAHEPALPPKYASPATTPLTCEIVEDRTNKVDLELVD